MLNIATAKTALQKRVPWLERASLDSLSRAFD